MKFIKGLAFSMLALVSFTMSSCEEVDGCTTVCGENEVLTIDCNCVALVTDPCADVTCPEGYICSNGDCVLEAVEETEISKAGLISEDETWTADKMYILQGKVVVDNGATLTIEPGTIIKGAKGVGSLASALIVARGGKLMAEGTADAPIVLTSIDDNIQIGEKFGSNLDETINQLWGGLIILGNAPISAGSGAEAQIEGIPADDTYGAYGGSDINDNSGVIKYVSVRHGGVLIGDGNEINGITLGGVGNGTVFEMVEVVGNLDDGIEFFGGSVNLTGGLVWGQGDDGYDIDQTYSGTVDGSIYIAGADSDHALEIDGPENSINDGGMFTFQNSSLKGMSGEYADWRSNAQGSLLNNYFFNFGEGEDMELDNDGVSANYAAGKIIISGNEFMLPAAVTDFASIFADKAENGDDAKFKADMTGANSAVTTRTVGADPANFDWTFAASKGALEGF
ncbi:hypothetical protein [Jiulongibacter sp. NS-SX5]|uniref:hypothetical protein n=1 Tax=Jiulongibacter sp. NS-SX5 TaxID=3463854 RepID=UPI004058AFAB